MRLPLKPSRGNTQLHTLTLPSHQPRTPHSTFPFQRRGSTSILCSFLKSSAGGPDGLRPQHLKNMLLDDSSRQFLLPTLASFVQPVLEGRTTLSIRPFFFGANLTALHKKDIGICPIALSCTLRRLVAEIATGKVKEELTSLLAPQQLGFGTKGGAEAAVHADRMYAFNSLRRDRMLLAIQELAPALYSFVHSSYSLPSSLFWHDSVLQSAEEVQQDDPLSRLLFCLSIHDLCSQLMSEFNVWHLDDSSVGGTLDDVRHELEIVQHFGSKLGLHLNH